MGKILLIAAMLMLPPIIISAASGASDLVALLLSALVTAGIGGLLLLIKPKNTAIFAKEGFVIVALAWVLMSLLGALPFLFGGVFTSYIDAVFETASGFTTTGATVCLDISGIPHGIGFWRCFIIFIGGMGVLVFVMAVLPLSKERSMHIMRAEVPGPSVGKLVAKAKNTAIILYAIYFMLMLTEAIMLLFGGMSFYEAFTTAMSTAGTGGFMVLDAGMIGQSPYLQTVATVFMLIFAINFNLYFYILLRKVGVALKNEELHWFLGVYLTATLIITLNARSSFGSFSEAFHHAAFNTASIISTTGFASADFNAWPTLSKCVLLLMMLLGGCAGSTGGGIKISRFIILVKNGWNEMRRLAHPKYVHTLRLDGKPVQDGVVRSVLSYFSVVIALIVVSILIVSIDGRGVETTVSAVFACIFNVGPGFGAVGPVENYADFSDLTKIVLTLDMLIGRLEVWPILLLFAPSTWRKRSAYR